MEDIDGGLHPTVDGQSLGAGEGITRYEILHLKVDIPLLHCDGSHIPFLTQTTESTC